MPWRDIEAIERKLYARMDLSANGGNGVRSPSDRTVSLRAIRYWSLLDQTKVVKNRSIAQFVTTHKGAQIMWPDSANVHKEPSPSRSLQQG